MGLVEVDGGRRTGIPRVGARRIAAIVLASLVAWGMTEIFSFGTASGAEVCSSIAQEIRKAQPHASLLPDCRAYEQVSPTVKDGTDAVGSAGNVQASQDGGQISFFSVAPFPGTVGSAQAPSYLGVRSSVESDWSIQGLEALANPGAIEEPIGIVGDTGKALLEVRSEQSNVPCEPRVTICADASESNLYLRDSTTGEFELLASQARTEEGGYADATPNGSRILFETKTLLTPEAKPGVNLYEWNGTKPVGERVSLAGVLPNGAAPTKGSFAGAGGPATVREVPRKTLWPFFSENTISTDGSRVFFSDFETGFIYMREPEAKKTIQISAGKAFWRDATNDGLFVFYTEGNDLYRFNVKKFGESVKSKPEPEALAEAREPVTSGAEGVLGVLGISETDGSYVYFAAHGALASASNTNGHSEKAVKGANNVYEWHNGSTTFIVRLPDGEEDWTALSSIQGNSAKGPSGGERSARVTPDGKFLLFYSHEKLTKYNNNGENEFYLYDSTKSLSLTNPICVSCNPNSVPATGNAHLTTLTSALAFHPRQLNPFMTHNLSNDGKRVFFETREAMVAGDGNLTTDVYEWEANGEGSCESEAQNGGCLYLISTGQSPQESYFGDASVSGSDVFFFTRQGLTTQDVDNNVDLYDARLDGGILGQNPAPAAAPCAGESACRGASSSVTPTLGVPGSTAFYGAGNLVESQPSPPTPPTSHGETRAEKLAKALKVCRAKPRAKRRSCEKAARRRYGPVTRKAKKAGRRGGSR